MTAFSNKKTVQQVMDAGMNAILYKPTTRKAFEEEVKKLVDVQLLKYISAKLKLK